MDDPPQAGSWSRRALVRNSAWTLPVILAATAAPAIANSVDGAPTIPPLSSTNWTLTAVGTPKKDGAVFGTNTTGSYLNVTADPSNNSTWSLTASTSIYVVAGTIYHFAWSYVAFANNPRPMSATLQVNGTSLAGGVSTATWSGTAVTGTVTQNYTATVTGMVTLSFFFTISASGNTTGGDDFLVYAPTCTV